MESSETVVRGSNLGNKQDTASWGKTAVVMATVLFGAWKVWSDFLSGSRNSSEVDGWDLT